MTRDWNAMAGPGNEAEASGYRGSREDPGTELANQDRFRKVGRADTCASSKHRASGVGPPGLTISRGVPNPDLTVGATSCRPSRPRTRTK